MSKFYLFDPGLISLAVSNPLFVVKTRLCLQLNPSQLSAAPTDSRAYKGMIDCICKTYKFEGSRGCTRWEACGAWTFKILFFFILDSYFNANLEINAQSASLRSLVAAESKAVNCSGILICLKKIWWCWWGLQSGSFTSKSGVLTITPQKHVLNFWFLSLGSRVAENESCSWVMQSVYYWLPPWAVSSHTVSGVIRLLTLKRTQINIAWLLCDGFAIRKQKYIFANLYQYWFVIQHFQWEIHEYKLYIKNIDLKP